MNDAVAIIDIDGVLFNIEARKVCAVAARRARLEAISLMQEDELEKFLASKQTIEQSMSEAYWNAMFDTNILYLDTLIPGVREDVEEIQERGCKILFLSSRPESMRIGTERQLVEAGFENLYFSIIGGRSSLILKPTHYSAVQFSKTIAWKLATIHTLAAYLGPKRLLVVDDETQLLAELRNGARIASVDDLRCFESLAEAAEDDPRLPQGQGAVI